MLRTLHVWSKMAGACMMALASVGGVADVALAQCPEWLATGATRGAYFGGNSFGSLVRIDHDQDGPRPATFYGYVIDYYGGNSGPYWQANHGAFTLEGGSAPILPLVYAEHTTYRMLPLKEPAGGFPAGTLIVSGSIRSTDGSVIDMGAWDGITFRSVGPAVESLPPGTTVYSVVDCDPDCDGPLPRCIVACGNFTTFRGVPTSGVVAWDGQSWSDVALELPGPVTWLEMFDLDGQGGEPPKLHAFVAATTQNPYGVYRCDGSAWSLAWSTNVGIPFTHDPDGQGPLAPQFRTGTLLWNGTAWEPLNEPWPTDFPGGPQAVQSFDLDGDGPGLPTLVTYGLWSGYTSTRFRMFAVLGSDGWYFPPGLVNNGQSSQPTYASYRLRAGFVLDPDGPGPRGNEFAMLTGGPGSPGAPNTASGGGNFVSWDGTALRPFQSGFLTYDSQSLSSPQLWGFSRHDADGPGPEPRKLYVTGGFRNAFNTPAAGIAVFQSGQWRGLGQPDSLPFTTRWLVDFDHDGNPNTPDQMIGMAYQGAFSTLPLTFRWNGAAWEALGNLTVQSANASSSGVTSACTFDEDGDGPNPASLFIAGLLSPSSLLRLSENQWIPAGTVTTNAYYFLNTFDPDDAGPEPRILLANDLQSFVRWTGDAWAPYGGTTTTTNAASDGTRYRWNPVVFDTDGPGPRSSELVVGAYRITTPQGVFYGAAAFNGATWRGLGPSAPTNFPVQAIRSTWAIDFDGPGPGLEELFLCATTSVQWLHNGLWTTIPIAATGVAGFEEGVEGPAPNELWFAGAFTDSGGLPATGFARWRLAAPISILSGPITQGATRTGSASFTVIANGTEPRYQWRRNGIAIMDGPGGATPRGGIVSGSHSSLLVLDNVACSDTGTYDCVLTNACGEVLGGAAQLNILSPCCPADLDSDGDLANGGTPDDTVTIDDLLFFLAAFESGAVAADLDNDGPAGTGTPDGGVTIDDLLYFLARFEMGC